MEKQRIYFITLCAACRMLCLVGMMSILIIPLKAQNVFPDTLKLQEIEVKATRIRQPFVYQPTDVEVVDSSHLDLLRTQNLGQVLTLQSSLFIKDNGPGSFSNASQRGLSSEQIQVLWEGIPINNMMLGQTDLSLLPADFFSDIQISSGTPSTAFGGGGLSGALYLSSDNTKEQGLNIRQSAGSFGRLQTSLEGQYHTDGFQIGLKGLIENAENDYRYYNRAYGREERREHNRTKRQNIMTSLAHGIGAGRFSSVLWLSNNNNQIPGTILTTDSEAQQDDKATRWLSTYETRLGAAEISMKNYLDQVVLNYFDPESGTRSLSKTRRWMVKGNLVVPVVDEFLWKAEISGALTGVESNNFTSAQARRQVSLLVNPELKLLTRRLRVYPALRLDMYNDFGTVMSPSLGANYELFPNRLHLRGQVSRDFNPPTFNALYWPQGGNPDLHPERSSRTEFGLTVTPYRFGFESIRLTGYYADIDDGIRWFPNEEGTYTPSNVEQITTKGLEARINNHYSLPGRLHLELEQLVTLTRTEITQPRFPDDASVGYQMRYVPKWKYKTTLSVQKGLVTAQLNYQWIGRRYTTDTENRNNSLKPYHVVDAMIQFRKHYRGFDFTAQGSINNLFNARYEIIEWYAMPLRNVMFSLTATYHL